MSVDPKSGGGKTRPDTVGRVMDLMVEIALEKGLDALSMRDVAKRAGISLAALQYHFPSKDALIVAFVEGKLEAYRNALDAKGSLSGPPADLRNIVRLAIEQTLDERTDDIFTMLDARSRHDRSTALAMDRFMGFYLETFGDVILRQRPDLSRQEAWLGAARIVAMIEGLSSVRSAAAAMGVRAEDLSEAVVAAAQAVISAPRRI